MTHEYVISLADPRATLAIVGGKGASLARLFAAGLPVPGGFHVTTAAYNQFVAENDLQPRILAALQQADVSQPSTLETASRVIHDLFMRAAIPQSIADAVARAYADLGAQNAQSPIPNLQPTVAVRSSATAEDLPNLSFAGQQETFLNIHGVSELLDAVKRCWASLWTARAIGYRMQHTIDQNAISLAVVVQQLVLADAAGILFTANPITGQRDQAMLTATWGLGEAIVGGLVTPDTLTVDKATGRVLARETADKQVMTVRMDSGTEERPVPEAKRRAPVLDDDQAAELTRLGALIEHLYQMPMDIEWAWTAVPSPVGRGGGGEGTFHVLQARPITALPEPEALASIEWKPPNPKGVYMRGSVVDLMPDPVSPLFASMGIPGLVAGVDRVGRVLTRTEPVLTDGYFTTINSYAYMNAALPPRAWWWIITGMLPAYPRMLRMMIPFWRDQVRPQYQATLARRQGNALDQMPTTELWRDAQEIIDTAMYYVGTLMFATMGASAGSEGLLTKVYEKLAKREGDPPATTLLMGYDSIPVRAEKSLYDLAMWCRGRKELTDCLLATSSEQIVAQLRNEQAPSNVSTDDWQALRQRFEQHLNQFGHIIYELDFAKALPLDHPAPMLETIKMYLRGEGTNPHERQRASEEKRKQTAQTMLSRLKGMRLWAFRKALNWAQSLAEVREDALADIGLGYPLLRRMLRELGRRLVKAGAIQQAEDIFWLVREEIETCVTGLERGLALDSLSERVEQRKAFWQAAKRVTPPPMIPMKKKYLGFNTDLWVTASESDQVGDTLKGVGASAGCITASACVLHGPEDFDQMRPGDVLVAATTTPAWTPLFAMASAVVTDIGGPLSHGSIVAREYGIPAVMGTGVATKRIKSGQRITVDGSAGVVILSKNGETQ